MAVILVGAVMPALRPGSARSASPEPVSAATAFAAIRRNYDSIHDLRVSYSVVVSQASDRRLLAKQLAVTYAARGVFRLAEYLHGSATMPLEYDIDFERDLLTDTRLFAQRPVQRTVRVSVRTPARPFLKKSVADMFLESIGWWPPSDTSDPPKRPVGINRFESCFLNRDVKPENYTIREGREPATGSPCYILEHAGVDKLWVDLDAGGILRRREWYYVEPRGLAAAYTFSDFTTVASGAVLPKRIRRVLYDVTGDDSRRTVFTDVDLTVSALSVNALPPDAFVPPEPPGTIILAEGKEDRCTPEGLDLIDEVVALAKARAAVHDRNSPARGTSVTAGSLNGTMALGAVILLNLFFFYLLLGPDRSGSLAGLGGSISAKSHRTASRI
jgi:hypothetical protein